jgi:hypothetical protein
MVRDKRFPKFVERISDGEILIRNEDGTYSLHNSMMARPHRWTYDRLFNDRRCRREFRAFRGIDLDKLVLGARKQIRGGKDYGLFALQRRFELRQHTDLGKHLYSESPNLKKVFNQYISDDDISGFDYTDVTGGPLNEKYDSDHWAKEVATELGKRLPENLVFYLRKDPELIAARILISVPDFYQGLTDREAIKKYGEETFDRMKEHMTAITITPSCDGKVRIPYSDLEYAFRKATGQRTNPEMWD